MKVELFKIRKLSSEGMSLVEVLVAVAIMGIMAMGMASLIGYQNKEVQSLKERLAASDFQQQLIRSFADGSVCKSVLTSPAQTFATTTASDGTQTAAAVALSAITSLPINTTASAPILAQTTKPVSPISNTLVASGFELTGITGSSTGGVGHYSANFQVDFDQTRLVRQIHPATVQIALRTQSVGSSQTVLDCTSSVGANVLTYQIGCQNGGPNPVANCTPPSCASGEIDRGVGCEMTSNMYGGSSGFGSVNCARTCTTQQTSATAVYVLSCPYGGDSLTSGGVHSCTPPTCYTGDVDKGSYCNQLYTNNDNTVMGNNGTWSGACRRVCFAAGQ